MPNSITDTLKSAKSTLAKAKGFTKSVEGADPGRFATSVKPMSASQPLTSPANRAAIRSQNMRAVSDVAKGAGMKGVGMFGTMHKGGDVKQDGWYKLQAGERVIPRGAADASVKIKAKGADAMRMLGGEPVSSSRASDHGRQIPAGMQSRSVKRNAYYNDDGGVHESHKTPHDRMPMEKTGPNPALSQAQQKAMAIALHNPSKLYSRNKGLAKMKKSDLKDFASTSRKGLPKKAKKST